jgi:hypothetical protein
MLSKSIKIVSSQKVARLGSRAVAGEGHHLKCAGSDKGIYA